jgi:uncharacterized protein YgiM (DUF1202 family)/peptidoglycan/xylan/chitin deacetylase (PgdA/CDA1 family)
MYRRSSPARLPSRRALPARRQSRSRSSVSGPIVAFLLIASFGILFAGCSSQKLTIKGPTAEEALNDVTFTQQDVEKFHELADSSSSNDSTTVSVNDAQGGSSSAPIVLSVNQASGSTVPSSPIVLDLSQKQSYDALRVSRGASQPNVYKVINSFANVRKEASSKSAQVAVINNGDEVVLVQFVDSEWAKVKMKDGKEGYVVSKYLARFTTQDKLEAEKKAFGTMYYVSFAFVNVRATPDQKGEKLGQIPGKQFVQPQEIKNGWAKIQFQGKDGYVSMDYLKTFTPQFLVSQNSYTLPVFMFDAGDEQAMMLLVQIAQDLRKNGAKLMTFRDFRETLLQQQKRDFVFSGKNVIIAVKGLNRTNALKVSDALNTAGIPATLFIETRNVGISGITQKTLLRLVANGFDIQSAGHSGEDLRALTSAQVKLEVEQSRKLLEDAMGKTVFAISYAQGGVNDRVQEIAAAAGYLFGVGSSPDSTFGRDQLLNMPSYAVTSSMQAEDVVKLVK